MAETLRPVPGLPISGKHKPKSNPIADDVMSHVLEGDHWPMSCPSAPKNPLIYSRRSRTGLTKHNWNGLIAFRLEFSQPGCITLSLVSWILNDKMSLLFHLTIQKWSTSTRTQGLSVFMIDIFPICLLFT